MLLFLPTSWALVQYLIHSLNISISYVVNPSLCCLLHQCYKNSKLFFIFSRNSLLNFKNLPKLDEKSISLSLLLLYKTDTFRGINYFNFFRFLVFWFRRITKYFLFSFDLYSDCDNKERCSLILQLFSTSTKECLSSRFEIFFDELDGVLFPS